MNLDLEKLIRWTDQSTNHVVTVVGIWLTMLLYVIMVTINGIKPVAGFLLVFKIVSFFWVATHITLWVNDILRAVKSAKEKKQNDG